MARASAFPKKGGIIVLTTREEGSNTGKKKKEPPIFRVFAESERCFKKGSVSHSKNSYWKEKKPGEKGGKSGKKLRKKAMSGLLRFGSSEIWRFEKGQRGILDIRAGGGEKSRSRRRKVVSHNARQELKNFMPSRGNHRAIVEKGSQARAGDRG